MIIVSNKCNVCFIAFLDTEAIWFGEIIFHEDMITLVISWRPFSILPDKRVLTLICELHQTFSYSVVYSENFHIGGIF